MWRWYQSKLTQRPILTQAVTTAVLFATGDTLAQHAVEKKSFRDHEYPRTGRMALYGGFVFGPAATKWYQILQKRINFKSTNATIAARVLTDQTVFASTNMFVFLSTMTIMEGGDPKEKLAKKLYTWIEGKLDALAGSSSRQFQSCSTGTSSSGREHCELGMELLFELFEFKEMKNANGYRV